MAPCAPGTKTSFGIEDIISGERVAGREMILGRTKEFTDAFAFCRGCICARLPRLRPETPVFTCFRKRRPWPFRLPGQGTRDF